MSFRSGWLVRWIVIGGSAFVGVAGCGSDDDGSSNPYRDVEEWKCYEGGPSCSCDGLQAGQDSAGSNEVDACSGSFCKTYLEDDWWTCECRDEDWDPKETAADPVVAQHDVASCPPP